MCISCLPVYFAEQDARRAELAAIEAAEHERWYDEMLQRQVFEGEQELLEEERALKALVCNCPPRLHPCAHDPLLFLQSSRSERRAAARAAARTGAGAGAGAGARAGAGAGAGAASLGLGLLPATTAGLSRSSASSDAAGGAARGAGSASAGSASFPGAFAWPKRGGSKTKTGWD
jgi:hypothetical protein